MYQWLILLLILNVSLLAWNLLAAPAREQAVIPPTLDGVPELVKVENVPESVQFSSQLSPNNSSCYTLGPYTSVRSAQMVQDKIKNYGLAVKMRTHQSMETLNFLVYVPAFESIEKARKVKDDLRKFDVNDIYIIKEGPYKNAISLGFFANLQQAKRHTEYVRYLGYDARYTEQQAPREVYWLDYDEPIGGNTPVTFWSQAVDASSSVQRIPRACR